MKIGEVADVLRISEDQTLIFLNEGCLKIADNIKVRKEFTFKEYIYFLEEPTKISTSLEELSGSFSSISFNS